MAKAMYLGDGAYATIRDEKLTLTTDSHLEKDAGNIVILGPDEWASLVDFMKDPNLGDDVD